MEVSYIEMPKTIGIRTPKAVTDNMPPEADSGAVKNIDFGESSRTNTDRAEANDFDLASELEIDIAK